MEDKLTGKDFFAVIGILAIAGFAYMLLKHREKLEKQNSQSINGIIIEEIPITAGVYAPSNVLDGYMQVYDTSEANTIGNIEMVALN